MWLQAMTSRSATVLLAALVLCYLTAAPDNVQGVYVYQGNPFHRSSLPVNTLILNKEHDGIPMHTEIFYPAVPGNYTPILFLPGLNGLVYPEYYSTVMLNFAAFGYIVAGVDPFWPAVSLSGNREKGSFSQKVFASKEGVGDKLPVETFHLLQWLVDNLNSDVLSKTEVANLTADWQNLGLLSHSLGADTLIQMLRQNKTLAKAVAYLEPGSDHFNKPYALDYSIPTLSYGTQLCMESPHCCIEGMSYFHVYDTVHCPKILMNVTGYGHCDILNDFPGWEACHLSHFCKTDKSNNREVYREVFVPGVLSAFFGSYIQGNTDLLKYILTRDLMPVKLGQLQSDLNC